MRDLTGQQRKEYKTDHLVMRCCVISVLRTYKLYATQIEYVTKGGRNSQHKGLDNLSGLKTCHHHMLKDRKELYKSST